MRFWSYRPFRGTLWDYTVLDLTIGALCVLVCAAALYALATQA